MTNKDIFVNQFGKEAFDKITNSIKHSSNPGIDILTWFLEDYKASDDDSSTLVLKTADTSTYAENIVWEEADPNNFPKRSRRGGSRKGRGYDLKWYQDAVSDFYLGSAKSIEFKMSDDLSSGKKCGSLDGFKSRWVIAVKDLGLDEEIWVHKYYAGTVNECICLEKPNFKNSKAAGFKNMR